jgi:chemotaxis protein CheD
MRREFGGNPSGISHFDPVLDRTIERIHAGGFCVMAGEGVISTLLGSCIAVCLRDPESRVGAMNHFLLPEVDKREEGKHREPDARFGVDAIAMTLKAMKRFGADPSRLQAKVFGGADMIAEVQSVGRMNIRFVKDELTRLGIPVLAWDVGGTRHRVIRFFIESGRVMVHRGDSTVSLENLSAGRASTSGASGVERRTL